jgi:hypothetical protein
MAKIGRLQPGGAVMNEGIRSLEPICLSIRQNVMRLLYRSHFAVSGDGSHENPVTDLMKPGL